MSTQELGCQSWFKACYRKLSAVISALVVCVVIASCSNEGGSGAVTVNDDQASMAFTAPASVLQTRMVVRENLVLEVTIADQVFTVPPNANGQFIFQTTITPNTSTVVSLVWSEIIGERILRLATASKPLNVGSVSSPATISFADTEFNVEIDDDNDGFSNLEERRLGSDFDDINDPDRPPVIVELNFQLQLPVQLVSASETVRAQIGVDALVNDDPVLVTREADVWSGSTRVTENSIPLITATFFASNEGRLQLATESRSQNVGQGANVVFGQDDYEVDPFNADGDAFNNAEEIVRGSDPQDPLDPDGDGDSFADDADNCPTDANADQADIDSDGVGDVCDNFNNLIDPDEDGIANDGPRPDNCPVNANPSQQDEDGDGIGDACDNSNALDPDNDDVNDPDDNCPTDANTDQADIDNDEIGDECDPFNNLIDPDEDGVTSTDSPPDNCPNVSNSNQADSDGDGIGDACEVPNVAPTANAGADQTIDENEPLVLDGRASTDSDGTLVSFEWFEANVSLATGATATVSGLAAGTHLIDLVVTDNEGATDTDRMRVTVTAVVVENVPPTADAGPNQTIDEGDDLILDGSGSTDSDGTIESFEWFEGTELLATGESPTIEGLAAGTYLIDLVVTDDGDPAATDTDRVRVIVDEVVVANVPPVADAGPDQTIEEGEDLVLDGSGSTDSDGTISTYTWTDETGATSSPAGTGVSPTVGGLVAGTYTFELLVTDDGGDTDTDDMEVIVTAP